MSYRAWTTGEVRRLRAMRGEGRSVAEIAIGLDRTPAAVSCYLYDIKRRHGLPAIPKMSAEARREMEAA